MIATLVLLLLVCLVGIRFGKSQAYEGYISKDRSNSIKGIFILIVFFGHIKNYILNAGYAYHGMGDTLFQTFFSLIGQLMVVMFLFYSGYGVMESISRKGAAYVRAMPKHRILSTLLNFDVAVCFFLVVSLFLGKEVSIQKFLLSLLAWDSLGNSNWYIFAILVCYAVTWLLGKASGSRQIMLLGGVFITLTVVAIGLYLVKEPWWYNTLWAYPTGMFYSVYKKKIEQIVNKRYLVVLAALTAVFFAIYVIPVGFAGFKHNMLSVFFALLVVVLTMRVKVDNPVLRWCGSQLFPLYIYQRIPMMIFAAVLPTWMLSEQPLIYVAICLLATLLLACLYRFIRITL